MSAWAEVAIAAPTAAYALVSRRLAAASISAPMVFVAVGLLLGPLGLDVVDLHQDREPILALLEVTLVLVLFTDALAVRPNQLRRDEFLPARLLGIGFPLTMALGWLLAWPLLPGLTVWEMALVGIVLAPTDAALGLAAIANPAIPALVREGLNVESGLNDGLSLPFFVLALAAAVPSSGNGHGIFGVFLLALVVSTALGVAVGFLGGLLLVEAKASGWVEDAWQQLSVVAIALLSYTLAVVVDGSGFIAAWVAGLSFAAVIRQRTAAEMHLVRTTAAFAETAAKALSALSFLVFGAALLGPALQDLDWRVVAYALLSLTIIRVLPVVLSLSGSRLKAPTLAYISWFGPRGLASIVLGLLIAESATPGVDLVGNVIAVTVAISIVAHGGSARPLAARYATWYARAAAADPGDLREEDRPILRPRGGRSERLTSNG